MRIKILVLTFVFLPVCTFSGIGEKVGQPLSPWSEGIIDIHHINTGEGDAGFIIMPDGTTMMIDAGDCSEFLPRPDYYKAPRKPDATRTAGEWLGRYILARHPDSADPSIDYAIMTHFHPDHISAIADVADKISIDRLIDRSWPDYSMINDSYNEMMDQYLKFVDQADERGIVMERFVAGRDDQFTLKNKQYPDFSIRNLAVNGKAWTGKGSESRSLFIEGQPITENQASTALALRYGNFSYFTAGDLNTEMEKAIAWLTGPVDVHVANHHGSQAHPFFLRVIQPRVHIIEVWATPQPRPHVFDRLLDHDIYPGPRDIFMTNGMWPGRKQHLIERYDEETAKKYVDEYMSEVAADQGHIVVRVEPGGERYWIFVLDDTTEEFIINSIHGPYDS